MHSQAFRACQQQNENKTCFMNCALNSPVPANRADRFLFHVSEVFIRCPKAAGRHPTLLGDGGVAGEVERVVDDFTRRLLVLCIASQELQRVRDEIHNGLKGLNCSGRLPWKIEND